MLTLCAAALRISDRVIHAKWGIRNNSQLADWAPHSARMTDLELTQHITAFIANAPALSAEQQLRIRRALTPRS